MTIPAARTTAFRHRLNTTAQTWNELARDQKKGRAQEERATDTRQRYVVLAHPAVSHCPTAHTLEGSTARRRSAPPPQLARTSPPRPRPMIHPTTRRHAQAIAVRGAPARIPAGRAAGKRHRGVTPSCKHKSPSLCLAEPGPQTTAEQHPRRSRRGATRNPFPPLPPSISCARWRGQ